MNEIKHLTKHLIMRILGYTSYAVLGYYLAEIYKATRY